MNIFFVQALLGVALFFIINWIGKHSFSVGYREITLFVTNEDAPALNFFIRVLTPIVYILITSAILYSLKLDSYTKDFYLVNVYSILFRLLFNLLTQRGPLLNWTKQIIYWVAIMSISYLVYDKVIRFKHNLLPDFTSMANELWIIIAVFIFQLLNSLNLSNENSLKRKNDYLRVKYFYFKGKYGKLISKNLDNQALEIIAYSILIYEDFNRPRVIRYFEYLRFFFSKKTHSLGVMQFPTRKLINDLESIDLGTKKIKTTFDNIIIESSTNKEKYQDYWNVNNEIISKYNGGIKYYNEISNLSDSIKNLFYPTSKDAIFPFNTDEEIE